MRNDELPKSPDELVAAIRSYKSLPPVADRKRIRLAVGVSTRQMGAALGVSHMAIHNWERGYHPGTSELAKKYVDLLRRLEELA
jgi:DNA-binding transcriptional regulator YiaG